MHAPGHFVSQTASVTTLIFATQPLNLPVSAGTSGHLLGNAFAAELLGPGLGLLSIFLVRAAQAVAFADGGLTSRGVHVTLLGIVGVGVAWSVTRARSRGSPRRTRTGSPSSRRTSGSPRRRGKHP